MKQYLISIESPNGAAVSIGYYRDTPTKHYRIYYCGSDTGLRYERIGDAANRIKWYLTEWAKNGIYGKFKLGTIHDIPTR